MATATPQICLELKHISKCFGHHKVLEDLNLLVGPQEIVAIIGPNGAGKTTLFNIISGQTKANHGQVYYHGIDITAWPTHRICHAGIARTFQIPRCFPEMTALENVLMGRWFGKKTQASPAEHRDAVLELMEVVGLSRKTATQAKELTLSEQRRLEVARALATQPRLLLLDEIAAGLSPQAVKQSVELVEKLRARGLTLLIIDHFLTLTVKVSDRMVALDQGEKIIEGNPLEVMRHPDVVSAYLGERHKTTELKAIS
jgi:branched-chain amino acid transport system ATP-binding protein